MNSKLDQVLNNSALSDAGALVGRTLSTSDGQTLGHIAAIVVQAGSLSARLDDGSSVQLDGPVVVS